MDKKYGLDLQIYTLFAECSVLVLGIRKMTVKMRCAYFLALVADERMVQKHSSSLIHRLRECLPLPQGCWLWSRDSPEPLGC